MIKKTAGLHAWYNDKKKGGEARGKGTSQSKKCGMPRETTRVVNQRRHRPEKKRKGIKGKEQG